LILIVQPLAFQQNPDKMKANIYSRKSFIKSVVITGAVTGISGLGVMSSCNSEGEEEVSPAEDLMREHGLLNRILLIYDHCKNKLSSGEQFSLGLLSDSAGIIRSFIEDYHEKLEEDFLFPRFEKANQLTDLVAVLRNQHNAGRNITERILSMTKNNLSIDDSKTLINLLSQFNFMYRPHEAREDTVLFPALKKIISSHEYDSLGEDFENKEHELFGKDGFESMVEKVSGIEKQLGIYEISLFTPVV
jgi:hemerythrin-like domain-containing protein